MIFNECWKFITQERPGVVTVQNYEELECIFNLIQGCKSYLEVGSAEGNSLYVLSHALEDRAPITYIDYGEKHTKDPRSKVLSYLVQKGHAINEVLGDSNDFATASRADGKYDVVFIDAGHDDFNVAIDAILYGRMATKYLLFHDIQLPQVNRAFTWYCEQRPDCKVSRIINSEHFGFGIMEIQ